MNTTAWLQSLRRLLLALWVGGLAAIDFVETPVRFGTKEVDRNQIVAIGRRVFAAVNRLELLLGLLLLPLVARKDARAVRWSVLTMWSAAVAQYALVQPQMQRADTALWVGHWGHETDAWRRYADRLREIAARRGLTVEQLQ